MNLIYLFTDLSSWLLAKALEFPIKISKTSVDFPSPSYRLYCFIFVSRVVFPSPLYSEGVFCLYRGPVKLPVLEQTLPTLPPPARLQSHQKPDLALVSPSFCYLFHPSTGFPEHLRSAGFGLDAKPQQLLRPPASLVPSV